ncbi:hypothetical protein Tco_0822692, partial [Tanacetum coccineum]
MEAVVSAVVGNGENAITSLTCWIWRPTGNVIDHTSKDSGSHMLKRFDYGNPQYTLQDQGIFDSGCSRHITGNKSFLTDYQEIDGRFVAFGGSPKGGSRPDWLFDIDADAVADDASKKTTEEPANEGERNGQEKERETLNKEGNQHVQDLRVELDKLLVQQKEDLEDTTDLLDTSIFSGAYDDEDVGAEADLNNLETTMN